MAQFLDFFANHPVLFGALALVLLLLVANEIHGGLTGEKRLSTAEAVRLINDRDALIVDLRSAADFKRGHLLNAINLPAAKLGERASELGKDKARPVLLYCALGSASAQAASQLKKLGHAEVYPLSGGINNWLGANLPVTAK